MVMKQGFVLPNRIHDIGSLVVFTKQLSPQPLDKTMTEGHQFRHLCSLQECAQDKPSRDR
jgi:hypothetical protein